MHTLAFFQMLTLFGRQWPVRTKIDAPGPAIMVIDRHPHVAAQGMVAEWRDQVVPGKDPLSNAPIVRIDFHVAAAEQCQASVMLLDLEGKVAFLLDVTLGLGYLDRKSGGL